MTVKAGIVSLGEAGNLGDDLILLALLRAIAQADPETEVAYLGFDCPLDWAQLRSRLSLPEALERREYEYREVLPSRHRVFDDRDVVFVGGGGLFQTSHHPQRPYHWLGFLPLKGSNTRVVGVGLGFGPLSRRWQEKFGRQASPFHELHVRDDDSRDMVAGWGWDVERGEDFVDEAFLGELVPRRDGQGRPGGGTLGVSLREWPGLGQDVLCDFLLEAAKRHDCDRAEIFVLESKHGDGIDVEASRRTAQRLGESLETRVTTYSSANLLEFVEAMRDVDVAVSMKLHASAIWSNLGVPIYPIIYAPKIAAFFGRQYRGLELVDQICRPAPQTVGVPAAVTVAEALASASRADEPGMAAHRSTWLGAVREHVRSLTHDVRRKLAHRRDTEETR
ncbi:polysaccharide pyruvyl transferase WcaK-like protein [Micrococcus cohnii]|uniref:Polysaccharide pyruvyl transferase WcaK-like protein n=1 Tax=Micrococcus cohnii TaxID=993416 RepID=A0A7W7M3I4_9MICC|nr:polysaccharide pyruvyl transferase family protein [Micrococcus cohnii]MBB4735675.1 polysaccharide pyruvyl transferase WcaK-like protein [Micrococcus cohnii]